MLTNFLFSSQVIGSFALIGIAGGAQLVAGSWLRRRMHVEQSRRILVLVRNSLTAVVLIGLGMLWAREMQAVLLSIVAVLAALIVVSREALGSVLAALASTASGQIGMGSLVRIRGYRGFVVDRGALSLTIAELQPEGAPIYTGRMVHIPNSWMMTDALSVEDYTGSHVAHTVTLPVSPKDAVETAERLIAIGQAEYAVYAAVAEAELARFEKNSLMDAPSGAPRVTLTPHTADEVLVSLRMAMPKADKYDIEQRVLRAALIALPPRRQAGE